MDKQEKQFMFAVRKLERSLIEGVQFRLDKINEQYSFYQKIKEGLVAVLSQFPNQESFNYLTSEQQASNKNPFILDEEGKNPFRDIYFALTLWDSPERNFRGKPLEAFDNINPYKQEFLRSFYKLFEEQRAKEDGLYHSAIRHMISPTEEIDYTTTNLAERKIIVRPSSFLKLASKSYASREEGNSSFL